MCTLFLLTQPHIPFVFFPVFHPSMFCLSHFFRVNVYVCVFVCVCVCEKEYVCVGMCMRACVSVFVGRPTVNLLM